MDVTRDFPTPPFPLTTAITFPISERELAASTCGAVRLEQFSPQDEQSWLHSLISAFLSCFLKSSAFMRLISLL